MTKTDSSELDEILTKLENAVQHDLIIREQGRRSGRSPKSIHSEAKAQILSRYRSLSEIKKAVGEMDKLTIQEADGKCEDIRINTNAYIKEARNGLRTRVLATLKIGDEK